MKKLKLYEKLLCAYQQIRDNDLATELVVKTSIGDYSIIEKNVISFVISTLVYELETRIKEIEEKEKIKKES